MPSPGDTPYGDDPASPPAPENHSGEGPAPVVPLDDAEVRELAHWLVYEDEHFGVPAVEIAVGTIYERGYQDGRERALANVADMTRHAEYQLAWASALDGRCSNCDRTERRLEHVIADAQSLHLDPRVVLGEIDDLRRENLELHEIAKRLAVRVRELEAASAAKGRQS